MPYHSYRLPTLRLRGTPFEIGKQFGELARERILLHFLNQKMAMAALRPQQPEWWREVVHTYLPPYERLAPHFVEEMKGIACGAGLTFEEVLLINVRDELWASAKSEPVEACTAFSCSHAVTLSGEPILGQTKDTGALSKDLYVVIALYQQGGPDLLQMAYAGELGVMGLSSAGMSILGNSLTVQGRPGSGLPVSLFRRLALEAETVDDVIRLVDQNGIATPGCFSVGDRTGRAISIENTACGHAIVEAVDGILVHTNHIDSSSLRDQEAIKEPERSCSYHRQARLRMQLSAERGRLTPTLALRCLMDHEHYPYSICRHPATPGQIQTTAAFVVEPTRRRMHTIRGFPCQNWPTQHTL